MSDHREHRHHDRESYDPLVEETEEERQRSAAARLFDIRRVIGGLFVVYGLIVGLMGLFDSSAEIDKAQGVRINLWAGLVMLVFGLLMLAWQWVRPNEAPAPHRGEER
ncbi:hypothetical protein Q2K19_16935 [Micromonospora soli]|uniref:hypothetical protein n=1 Tax=Micromonospora sp. NBRC 110009 TaxID=3061627 RepID=UPI0026729449|nr:hypothetical protein [Micromonospora sp. NBRC 110009]WKT95936.1 hypothetical protein Q2K19_16935 [Micromonospora sp. NBRC 110009]